MENDLVHIALASNHRYLPGLRATVISLIQAASDSTRLRFHVFSDGLLPDDKKDLEDLVRRFGYAEAIDFREPDMSVLSRTFKTYNGSYTTFLRLYFADFLSDLDWVLWTDVDILWFRNPLRLWEERDDGASVVWSPDIPSTRKATRKAAVSWRKDFDIQRYCCAGVMLMNLKRMRENNFITRCAEFVRLYGSPLFADQDILNAICYDDAKIVDERWDLLYPISDIGDGVVIHFNGIGPKFNDPAFSGFSPLYEIWFRYCAQVIEGRHEARVCSWLASCWFALLATLYPLHRVIAFFTDPIQPWCSDFIQRNLLYAWLRRKQLWRKV